MAKQKKEEVQLNGGLAKRPFENDADKIVHRHLADPNHVITDEELRSIRVGVAASADERTGDEAKENGEERIADKKADDAQTI